MDCGVVAFMSGWGGGGGGGGGGVALITADLNLA